MSAIRPPSPLEEGSPAWEASRQEISPAAKEKSITLFANLALELANPGIYDSKEARNRLRENFLKELNQAQGRIPTVEEIAQLIDQTTHRKEDRIRNFVRAYIECNQTYSAIELIQRVQNQTSALCSCLEMLIDAATAPVVLEQTLNLIHFLDDEKDRSAIVFKAAMRFCDIEPTREFDPLSKAEQLAQSLNAHYKSLVLSKCERVRIKRGNINAAANPSAMCILC